MGIADTVMIGRYGTNELAAAGFVNNIIGMVLIAGIGFSYGLTPVVGALFGQGHLHLIGGKLKNSLVANALMAALLMALMVVLYLCMDHVGLPQHLIPLMRPYLLVLTLSLLPQMMFNAFKQFFDGIQDTRSAPTLSTSKVKRKLPGHPIVPSITLPSFSLAGSSKPSSKKGSACMAARVPSFVSIIFFPVLSCVVSGWPSFAQSL